MLRGVKERIVMRWRRWHYRARLVIAIPESGSSVMVAVNALLLTRLQRATSFNTDR